MVTPMGFVLTSLGVIALVAILLVMTNWYINKMEFTDKRKGPPLCIAPLDTPPSGFRRFVFQRFVDVSGQSGTGVVVQGCQYSNGWVGITWMTDTTSLTFYPSIQAAIKIHGHNGATELVWIDNE